MRKITGLAPLILIVLLLGGCAARQSAPAMAPAPVATTPAPAVTAPPPAPAVSPNPQTNSAPNPAAVHLVPLDPSLGYSFALQYPEGWRVTWSANHASVSIHKGDLGISVMTQQLHDQKAPLTEADMLKNVVDWAPDATVRQIQVPGTVSAFEIRHNGQVGSGAEASVLEIDLYGKKWEENLSFIAPATTFPDWEPVFRQIQASFQHSDLDNMLPNGRP